MIRHQEGRSVRVWEVMVLNGVMLPEIVEDLLERAPVSQMLGRGTQHAWSSTRRPWATLPASSLNHCHPGPGAGEWNMALDWSNLGKGFAAKINSQMPRYP